MATVNVNSIVVNSIGGTNGYGPFSGKNINSVDLSNVPWTNNTMVKAFDYCAVLKQVTNINQNITNLAFTFNCCYNLVNVSTLPPNVTNMAYTFSSCYALNTVPNFPEKVTNLSHTFYVCRNLSTVPTLPNSVTDMGGMLYWCDKIETLPAIPSSVTNIRMAFANCQNLTGDIHIFSSIITDVQYVFETTSKTKNVYIPYNASLNIYTDTYNAFDRAGYTPSSTLYGVSIKENPFFIMYNNQFWYDAFYGSIHKMYTSTENDITIPNNINGTTITSVYTNFANMPLITSIDFNNTSLCGLNGYQAFCNCTNLVHINNANLNSFSNMVATFKECRSLVAAPIIPNSITNLSNTFYNCRSFINAPEIPNSVTDMRETFSQCNSLINVPIIPNSVTNLALTFFNCFSLVTAPNMSNASSITNMYDTFYGCNHLTGNIYIKSNKITAAGSCFYLTNASLPKNVYIPFTYSNGINTLTYNSFILAGYKTDGSYYGVYLKDSGEH